MEREVTEGGMKGEEGEEAEEAEAKGVVVKRAAKMGLMEEERDA